MNKMLLTTLLTLLMGCSGKVQPNQKTEIDKTEPTVWVYFFHGTHRCTGCINAEKATITALNTLYKSQLDKGIIRFKSINFEDALQKKLVEKYEIAWNSLLIIPVKNEKDKVDLTEQAFSYGENPEGLKPYLKKVIDPLLNL